MASPVPPGTSSRATTSRRRRWRSSSNPIPRPRSARSTRCAGAGATLAKDLTLGSKCINAEAQTLAEKAAFRDAFKKRRYLIPASGFFEWKKTGGAKQPYAIVPKDEPVFAFASLCESWRDKAAGGGTEWVRTCAIVTGDPNGHVLEVLTV